jgi:hypothetical protein
VIVETTADAGHSPMLESPDWTANKIRHFVGEPWGGPAGS